MKIGKKLSDEDWETRITPVIVRLFSNPDRAIRVCLLDNLPNMIDHLSQKIVNDKVFPQMVLRYESSLQKELQLIRLGHRFYRCSTLSPRANGKSSLDYHHQAL